MTFYSILPPPEGGAEYAFWENNFSDEEVEKIVQLCNTFPTEKGWVGKGELNDQIRRTEVAWLPLSQDSQWIFDRLGWIVRQLNSQFFHLDILGFGEDLQYAIYHPDGSHYDWHIDKGSQTPAPRKLSLVMQLSDPAEYEGGDLQFLVGPEPNTATKRKGLVYVFPSYVVHRVTPVTKGIRRTLVTWLTGPRFR